MEKIGLLIDSTSLTRDEFLNYDFVKVVQLKVQIDGVHYDEKDLSKEQMLSYIEEGKKFLTSQPSPAEFLDAYKEFHKEGYTRVIAVVLSRQVSGTYQSALIGKSMVDFDMEIDVHSPVVASFGVSLGLIEIAKLIAAGKSYDEVTKKYHSIFQEPLVSFTLGDLKNLFRGGRLNRVQAFIGKILRIKPVIDMIDGKLELVRKERTNLACLEYFFDKIKYYSEKYKNVYLSMVEINMKEWGMKIIEHVKENYKNISVHITDYLSPVFYSHLGDKGFGIAVVAE